MFLRFLIIAMLHGIIVADSPMTGENLRLSDPDAYFDTPSDQTLRLAERAQVVFPVGLDDTLTDIVLTTDAIYLSGAAVSPADVYDTYSPYVLKLHR